MKIRLGFVTNSSSSSFMLILDSEGRQTDNPYQQILERLVFADMEIYSTKEAVEEYFNDHYGEGWRDYEGKESWCMKRYNQYMEAIEKGKILGYISIDYNDETKYEMVKHLKDRGLLDIVDLN